MPVNDFVKLRAGYGYFYNKEAYDAPLSIEIGLDTNDYDIETNNTYPAQKENFLFKSDGDFADTNGVEDGLLTVWRNGRGSTGSKFHVKDPDGFEWDFVVPTYEDEGKDEYTLVELRAAYTPPLVNTQTFNQRVDTRVANSAVLFDAVQTLSEEQKARARTNIGATAGESGGTGATELEELTDVDLTAPANDDFLQRKGGLFVNRSIAQVKTDLSINNVPNENAVVLLRDGVASGGDTLNKLLAKINAITAIIGDETADGDFLVDTVSELLDIFEAYPEGVNLVTSLGDKVNLSDVVNTLTETLSGKVLDARQGKALKDLIDALTTTVSSKLDAAAVRALTLTGLGAGTNAAIEATDSLLTALAKLQNQISNSSGGGTVESTVIDGSSNAVSGNAVFDALALKESLANKNQNNGYAGLDSGGKVTSALLPSYVDDILEFADLASFPVTGETGKIYVRLDTLVDPQYRWSGSVYQRMISSPGTTDSVTEGATNLYFTVARVLATVLTGISFVTNSAVVAADTILIALGKLQAQITSLTTDLAAKAPLANVKRNFSTTTGNLLAADMGKEVYFSHASAKAATVQATSVLGTDFVCALYNEGAGALTLTPDTGVTIRGNGTIAQYKTAQLRATSVTDVYQLVGETS